MNSLPCVLTIAGSDSGGGAGIQADIKTISILGCYAASVITAITAQNTVTVSGIEPVTPEFVALQIETVCADINVKGAKTGMLFSASIIKSVAAALVGKSFPLVVDPVCVATSGARLLKEDAVEAMKELFPLADLITPNIPEAELFAGMKIKTREDVFKAIEILLEMGSKAVLIKGGHFDSVASTDWLGIKGQKPIPLMQQRVKTRNTHGTGCTLSAAIASGLAKGQNLVSSILGAQKYLNLALRAGFALGEGGGPPNHLAPMLITGMKEGLLSDLHECGLRLTKMVGLNQLIPESRMNVAAALPCATEIDEVAAFTGRVSCTRKGEIIVGGYPAFGASIHMAKVVLCARKHNPDINCAIGIKYNDQILAAIAKCGFVEAWFDLADKPKDLNREIGSSIEWGTCEALANHDDVTKVDVVCDPGDIGVEPFVRILGKNFQDLEEKLTRVIGFLKR